MVMYKIFISYCHWLTLPSQHRLIKYKSTVVDLSRTFKYVICSTERYVSWKTAVSGKKNKKVIIIKMKRKRMNENVKACSRYLFCYGLGYAKIQRNIETQ